ncbi:MAG: bifunctional 4-hydroxy-2-oxoglutarate aldolase/2-dehydro-3-deoxy-phosphogluconate aldolase [candidate division KSB1 bacterium]|nr:bifunctional 4-hydroxy-2-oxoglutarate aldolase/2-dehydro-3-deoxy-phosphogluconate aldolase [candidate division KSB1 bacterium]MDZ7317938.1 bifunctional 4-hydroxy-2-oxoglutarate aldolase/2-dehydro-3-deoxy-phosphogluconate aldolase [candidate division KSB1 bacterium]
MNKSQQVFEQLQQNRLIALLTPKSADECVVAYETLNPLGITLEIAYRSDAAHDGICAVLQKYPAALILAGTVMMPDQAERAIRAGVAGIVSADYIPEVVARCVQQDVMCVPGGLADAGKQLVQKALGYGVDLAGLKNRYPYQWCYKLFPAIAETHSNIGLAKAWQGPFKGLQVIYTGGITLTNLVDVVKQDPAGIFCGSAVTRLIAEPAKMQVEAEKWLEIIHK